MRPANEDSRRTATPDDQGAHWVSRQPPAVGPAGEAGLWDLRLLGHPAPGDPPRATATVDPAEQKLPVDHVGAHSFASLARYSSAIAR